MIFQIAESLDEIEKIESVNFNDLDIWERKHIQEWIAKSPDILGEEILIITTEFDKFEGHQDRLDVLGIDRKGNLVVIELKRDAFAAYADLQSLRYAAMVSQMNINEIVDYYLDYAKKTDSNNVSDRKQAEDQISEFVEGELELKPRIILCSQDFSPQITSTVLWLRDYEVDISCIRLTPYKLEEKIIIVPNKIIPLKETEEYMVKILKKEETQERAQKSRPRTMKILIENGLLKEGDKIFLRKYLPDYLQYDETNPMYTATITGKTGQSNSIIWDKDNKEYAISTLTWLIFRDFHPEKKNPGGLNGNDYWTNEKGVSLWELKENYLNENVSTENL